MSPVEFSLPDPLTGQRLAVEVDGGRAWSVRRGAGDWSWVELTTNAPDLVADLRRAGFRRTVDLSGQARGVSAQWCGLTKDLPEWAR